jgi:hypothetical protein
VGPVQLLCEAGPESGLSIGLCGLLMLLISPKTQIYIPNLRVFVATLSIALHMNLYKVIADLRAEREWIEQAMILLENFEASKGKRRRGLPPKWLSDLRSDRPEPGQTRTTSTSKNRRK